jgi:YidC/Oxa1 family membrane protein insertase
MSSSFITNASVVCSFSGVQINNRTSKCSLCFWINDLSGPDIIYHLPFSVPVYGDHIAVLPLIMGITMFLQQKMMPTQASGQQKFMSYFMTGFFILLFNNFPSGLNLYYTLFNVFTILQQKFLTPPQQPTK